ncbi:MAG: hypothetical protein QM778_19365 [Myxococcales bacterium]
MVDTSSERRFSVLLGSLCVLLISFALAWIPPVNTFIGGFVAGLRLGSTRKALRAAVPCALAVLVGGGALLVKLVQFAPFLLPYAGWGTGLVSLIAMSTFAGALAGANLARQARSQPSRPKDPKVARTRSSRAPRTRLGLGQRPPNARSR